MTLNACSGEIVALIGPNGAGKSTVFNVVSGVLDATSGAISISRPQHRRLGVARYRKNGVSRTFQHVRLFRR